MTKDDKEYLIRHARLLGVKPRFWHTEEQIRNKCRFVFKVIECRSLITHAKAVIDQNAFWSIGHQEAVRKLSPKLKKLFFKEVKKYRRAKERNN